jgi:hypothetical protein
MVNLSNKRNGRRIECLYPHNGNSNVLRSVKGVKLRSFTGPGGKGITVQEDSGQIRSLSLKKVVQMS